MSTYNHQQSLKMNRDQSVKHIRRFNSHFMPAVLAGMDPAKSDTGKYPLWFQQLLKPAANNHLHTWYAENIYPEPEY